MTSQIPVDVALNLVEFFARAGFCGNAVFSRLPPLGVDGGNRGVLLDKGRHKEDRCAALLTIPVGGGAAGVTIASVHLDVWAEGGYFGLAEGDSGPRPCVLSLAGAGSLHRRPFHRASGARLSPSPMGLRCRGLALPPPCLAAAGRARSRPPQLRGSWPAPPLRRDRRVAASGRRRNGRRLPSAPGRFLRSGPRRRHLR